MENNESPEKKLRKKKRKKRIRRIIITLVVLLLLAVAVLMLIDGMKAKYTVSYQPYTVTQGTISNALSFSGTLQAVNNETLTAPADCTVRTLFVKEGDSVTKGQKLMRLSSGKTLTASFDGTVNTLFVSSGDSAVSGDSLIQIVDFSHMKVSIRVDEYDINSVKTGDPCRITVTATEDTFTSSVSSVSHVSSSSGNVAYYTATAFADVTENVYPGMQVTVSVPREEAENVIILKADALSFDINNNAFVYIRGEGDTMSKKQVTCGISNGNYVEIISGLDAGETVYARVTEEESSTVSSMLSSLFGGSRVMGGSPSSGRNNYQGGFGGGNSRGNGFGGTR